MKTDTFAKKYNAVAFDPSDSNEALAERARHAVLNAYLEAMQPQDADAPRHMEYLMGGLLVGVVQVMQSSGKPSGSESDAAIRASIIQTAAWAVDTSRAMQGLDPLSDKN